MDEMNNKMIRPDFKYKFLWNMVGSLAYSVLSVVLLLIVNRTIGSEVGGIFAFSFAHSQLMYTVAVFEVRPIQTTDINLKYNFNTYLTLRILTSIVMIVLSIGYLVIINFDTTKSLIIITLCIYKMLEALVDVVTGLYQQMDQIQYTGQSVFGRTLLSFAGFMGAIVVTNNILAACVALSIGTIVSFILYDIRHLRQMLNEKVKLEFTDLKSLLIASIPLFIATFTMLYISNAPKYAIEKYGTDLLQNQYSILFMPAFTINLCSTFVFRPLLIGLTAQWDRRNKSEFASSILKLIVMVFVLTIVGMCGGYIVGIPILSILYTVDLEGCRMILVLTMLYGGLNAITVLLYYMITIMRKQKQLLLIYLVVFIVVGYIADKWVESHLLLGAIGAAIVSLGILNLGLITIVYSSIKQSEGGNYV